MADGVLYWTIEGGAFSRDVRAVVRETEATVFWRGGRRRTLKRLCRGKYASEQEADDAVLAMQAHHKVTNGLLAPICDTLRSLESDRDMEYEGLFPRLDVEPKAEIKPAPTVLRTTSG